MDQSPIIVGGGIAGLSTALALAHKGIATTLIEKCTQLDAVGAGIQLTPMQPVSLHIGEFSASFLKKVQHHFFLS